MFASSLSTSVIEAMCRSGVLPQEPILQVFFCGKKISRGRPAPRIVLADSHHLIDVSFDGPSFQSDDLIVQTVAAGAHICLVDYTLIRVSKSTNRTHYYIKVAHFVKPKTTKRRNGVETHKGKLVENNLGYAHMQDIDSFLSFTPEVSM